ncbi:hypothetical protein, partial [Proteus terrae]
ATKEVDGYPMFDAMTQGVDINDPRISINELSEMLLSARANLSSLHSSLQVRLYNGRANSQPQYAAPSANFVAPSANAGEF